MEDAPVTEIADTFSLTISSKFNYPDVALFVLALRDRLGLQHFVETGAFLGATARWASQHFEVVTTIEINPTFHGMASSKMPANVHCLLGDSRILLPQIAAGLTTPALFYLDAHNVNGLFGSRPDDCPTLDELEAVLPLPSCAVLIDDADTFTGKNGAWPSVLQIATLVARHGQTGGVSRNMLALVPREAADLLHAFIIQKEYP